MLGARPYFWIIVLSSFTAAVISSKCRKALTKISLKNVPIYPTVYMVRQRLPYVCLISKYYKDRKGDRAY